MSLKVKDTLTMEYIEEFNLIAGKNGLNNKITTVGILDHELIENQMDIFVEGEFVISTLSLARNDVNLVFDAIKSLIETKAAALAIKSFYYSSLPEEIIDYADKKNFPIFFFHPSIFIENIIKTIFSGIKTKSLHDIHEAKIETLFSGSLNPYTVNEIAMELNANFFENASAAYCQEIRYTSPDNIIRLVEKYLRLTTSNIHHGVFKFRKGILIIFSYSDKIIKNSKQDQVHLDLKYLFHSLRIEFSDFITGLSSYENNISHLDIAIKESYYAFESALIEENNFLEFESSGLYQLIFPISENPWAEKFARKLIDPILEYDKKYNSNLYQTGKLYFSNGCNTMQVAKELFQHKNTILYRIRKIKELIGPFKSDYDFHEQLSVAIKIYEGQKNSI